MLKSRSMEWALVALVVLLAVAANVPEGMLPLDRRLLIYLLFAALLLALSRYSRFTLVLVVLLLATGANLPGEVGEALGMDPTILLIALAAMVVIAVLNQVFRLMPTGIPETPRSRTELGSQALFAAIRKGNLRQVASVVDAGVNLDVRDGSGATPLMAAIGHRDAEIARLLVERGADVAATDSNGLTALRMARRLAQYELADYLARRGAAE